MRRPARESYFLLAVLSAVTFAACSDTSGPPSVSPQFGFDRDTLYFTAIGDTATLRFNSGGFQVSYQVGDQRVASIDATAKVTALAAAWTRIIGTAGAHSDTLELRVNQLPTRIVLTPVQDTALIGGTTALGAAGFDHNGYAVSYLPLNWTSSNTAIATVNASGMVTGISAGDVTIQATSSGTIGESRLHIDGSYPHALFSKFTVGQDNVCALTTGGNAYCWGEAGDGKLASTATPKSCAFIYTSGIPCYTTPQRVSIAKPLTAISAAARHTCAVATDGVAYCWGMNGVGSTLGYNAAPFSQGNPPQAVQTGARFIDISTRSGHTCGLTAVGDIYCWGDGGDGQLGIGFLIAQSLPVRVNSSVAFRSASVGSSHTCALDGTGTAYCWGNGSRGQLGLGGTTTQAASPQPVFGNLTFTAIAAGDTYTCALTREGKAYCWGALVDANAPIAFRPTETWSAISARSGGFCGVHTDGTTWCDTITRLPDQSGYRMVEAGFMGNGPTLDVHVCGLPINSDELQCWGSNDVGQLGDGGTLSRTTPKYIYGKNVQ